MSQTAHALVPPTAGGTLTQTSSRPRTAPNLAKTLPVNAAHIARK